MSQETYATSKPDYHDLAVTTTEVHFRGLDRIKAAIAGRVDVKTRLYTENVIGHHKTTSEASMVWPWVRWWRNRRPRIGYEVTEVGTGQ